MSGFLTGASDAIKKTIMSRQFLNSLTGSWEGMCRTWFEPDKLADESSVKGQIHPLFEGDLVRHTYEGQMQGKPRRGEELIVFNSIAKRYQVSWIDDFHMSSGILFSEGDWTERGFSVKGKYDVGENDPPWGWRTVFELEDTDHLTITAYNIMPDGLEAMALETKYRRVKR